MSRRIRALVGIGCATSLVGLIGCSPKTPDGPRSLTPRPGGTLTILQSSEQFSNLDPQRNYVGEDMAFYSAFLGRSLTQYRMSPDPAQAGQLIGDLATDIGVSTNQGRTWSFGLKSGVRWEDKTAVTCADIKYGISRSFARDVIVDGPSYALKLLDIPEDSTGNPLYKGPYNTEDKNAQLIDLAIKCSPQGDRITFQLKEPAVDFNYTVSMAAFGPVPASKDTGEKYGERVFSNGPYRVKEYSPGQQLRLVRNLNWNASADPTRPGYPDEILVEFGVDNAVIDQRLIEDLGNDRTALAIGKLETANQAAVFNNPQLTNRRINLQNPYSIFIAVNSKKVPNKLHRQAILAATDREAMRRIKGGVYAGELADGVIKPVLSPDYAPTKLWDSLLGEPIPSTGNIELAKKLIAQSGEPMPPLTYQYIKRPDDDKEAASFQASLSRAGIKVQLEGLPEAQFYSAITDDAKAKELMWVAWGPDWNNAATVIPPLFTPGEINPSRANDPEFNRGVRAAKTESNRPKQVLLWQQLHREALRQGWAVPLRFARDQRVTGSGIYAAHGLNQQVYLWTPYGAWPYADLYLDTAPG